MKDAIKAAAKGLDHARDDDWQEDGRPSLKRMHQLAKTTAITQDQLDDAVPDLRRNRPHNNGTTPTPDAARAPAVKPDAAKLAPAKVAKTATDMDAIIAASQPPEKKERKLQPLLKNVLVVATQEGHYGSKLRDPGEQFYFTGRQGSWMEIADAEERKRYAEERAEDA